MTLAGFGSEEGHGRDTDERLSSTPTRILLVDDDRVFARSLGRSLRMLGFTIDICNDGAEAMQQLETRHFDAVLLDLEMHPVDGWQVLELHSKLREPPAVVVLSGHLDVPRTVRALRAGVTDAFQKPIDPLELARGLKDAIAKRTGDASLSTPESEALDSLDRASAIIGHTPTLNVVRTQIRRVARYRDMPVLIVGEPGCEQDIVARAIHAVDGNDGPFEIIDCQARSPEDLESDVFGVASTANASGRAGILERAHGGTLFFDNISETTPAFQAKLLNVLETRRYRRVGGVEELVFRARIVSATQRPIIEGQIEGMRADLYYRLAGITVVLPPLRARMDDLAPLAEHFSKRLVQPGGVAKRFSARALGALHSYDWPGNLRELEGVVRAALRVSKGTRVGTKEVRAALRRHTKLAERQSSEPVASLAPPLHANLDSSLPTVERALIIDAFEAAQHNISEAARQLGIPRSTMRDRLRRLGMI